MARRDEYERVEVLNDPRTWQRAPCEEGVIYIVKGGDVTDPPGKPIYVRYRCPCGCGDMVALPIANDREEGEWGFSQDTDGRVTLDPSVLHLPPENSGNCKCSSHYFIRANRVEWC